MNCKDTEKFAFICPLSHSWLKKYTIGPFPKHFFSDIILVKAYSDNPVNFHNTFQNGFKINVQIDEFS